MRFARYNRMHYDSSPNFLFEKRQNAIYNRVKLSRVLMGISVVFSLPYLYQRVFFHLDKWSIWEKRIEEKRIQKMGFDWMLLCFNEKE
mmetsp:Transcript_31763/g.48736  ORF Transcript_31763/g.48736 Transcript_31763/m.48736 type:complete len:88 (-) Transcript_31763:47-310(-)